MKQLEIRWPTVALVAAVVAGIVAVFAFAGPDERADLLGILAMLGTAGAAVMRAAFGAQPAPTPKRIGSHDYDFRRCSECGREVAVEGHAEGCSKRDDDDPGEGGEVLADGPPTVPQRVSSRRNTLLAVPTGLALALLVGCSPSALQTHATIALVASHTLEATRAAEDATCLSLRDACAADLACLTSTKDTCVTIGDAQDAAVAAVEIYVDAVQLAGLADEGRVMEALRFALEAAARAWVSLGERLAVVGISLPALGGVQ